MKKSGKVDLKPIPKPAWYEEIAVRHYEKYQKNGRNWDCGCGACQKARLSGFRPALLM